MDDDRVINALEHISNTVSDIKVGLASMQAIVQGHERRLEKLEDRHESNKDDSFKSEMLHLVGKALIIALTIVASLTGASALLKQVLTTTGAN